MFFGIERAIGTLKHLINLQVHLGSHSSYRRHGLTTSTHICQRNQAFRSKQDYDILRFATEALVTHLVFGITKLVKEILGTNKSRKVKNESDNNNRQPWKRSGA